MKQRKGKPEQKKAQDWREDMQGATPEKLARALLRPVRDARKPRPKL